MHVNELREVVTEFYHKHLKQQKLPNWWRGPLLATAEVDARFEILPEIAAKNHMLPNDLLGECRTVVVFFIPFAPELSNGNIKGKFASADWGKALSLTNDLIQDISSFIYDYFAGYGYGCELTPATYNFDCESLTARWSHKHLAYLSGLGRFGVNAQMITPLGCAGRLGSLVTEAPLGDHPLVTKKELCLHKAGHDCLKCMENCPVQAVTLKGIQRHRCDKRLQVNRKKFAADPDMPDDMEVCAKCVSGMPCSLEAPNGPKR